MSRGAEGRQQDCFVFPWAYFNKYNEFVDKLLYKKVREILKVKDASVGKNDIMNMHIITTNEDCF